MEGKTHETQEGTPAQAHEGNPYGEHLTPEDHAKLAPLLQVAAVGNPGLQAALIRLTPGVVKRQQLKAKAIDALREHGTITHAAAAAGVAPSTIYRWRESDPQFAAEVDEFLNVTYLEELERSMFSIATSADPKMANAAVRAGEFLMKAEDPGKYGDKLSVDTRHELNVNVQITTELKERRRLSMQELERSNLPTVDAEFRVLEQALEERATQLGQMSDLT